MWDRRWKYIENLWDRSRTDIENLWDRSRTDIENLWDRSWTEIKNYVKLGRSTGSLPTQPEERPGEGLQCRSELVKSSKERGTYSQQASETRNCGDTRGTEYQVSETRHCGDTRGTEYPGK